MDAGVDTQRLYARLYLRDFESFRFEAWVYDQLHRTENGVVWLRIDREDQEKFGLSFENASAFAAATPMSSAPIRPGPCVTPMRSISSSVTPASSSACCITVFTLSR